MKKKLYKAPALVVIELEPAQMLAHSGGRDSVRINHTPEVVRGDANSFYRHENLWDDMW